MDRRRRDGNPEGEIEALSQSCRPLQVTAQVSDGVTVLSIRGELDFATAEPLCALVNTVMVGTGRRVALDLSGITFCDMSGLRALHACDEAAHASGEVLVLIGLPDRMRRLLGVSGLMPAFASIISTEDRPSRPPSTASLPEATKESADVRLTSLFLPEAAGPSRHRPESMATLRLARGT